MINFYTYFLPLYFHIYIFYLYIYIHSKRQKKINKIVEKIKKKTKMINIILSNCLSMNNNDRHNSKNTDIRAYHSSHRFKFGINISTVFQKCLT